jgi:hypothetical protein
VAAEGPLLIAFIIGTAMDHRVHHPADRILNGNRFDADNATDATHDREVLLRKRGLLESSPAWRIGNSSMLSLMRGFRRICLSGILANDPSA